MTTAPFELLTSIDGPAASPARHATRRAARRCGWPRCRSAWTADADAHRANLREGVTMAAGAGARLVCLQELTLSPYFAVSSRGPGPGWVEPEPLHGGPDLRAAGRAGRRAPACSCTGRCSRRSTRPPADGRGYNTAIVVAPDGSLVARTRKVHIPITAGYYEDRYFLRRRRRVPRGGRRPGAVRVPHLLGPVVPRAEPGLLGGRAPRCSSTRRRSGPSPITPTSTPSRCGSR